MGLGGGRQIDRPHLGNTLSSGLPASRAVFPTFPHSWGSSLKSFSFSSLLFAVWTPSLGTASLYLLQSLVWHSLTLVLSSHGACVSHVDDY